MLNRTPCTDVNPRSGQDRLCRVTCQLAPGIDPAQWHLLCRSIGQLDAAQFRAVAIAVTQKRIAGLLRGMLSMHGRSRRTAQWATETPSQQSQTPAAIPLVSIGPSGIGGPYQKDR